MICKNCGIVFDPTEVEYECDYYMKKNICSNDEVYGDEPEYETLCPYCKNAQELENIN